MIYYLLFFDYYLLFIDYYLLLNCSTYLVLFDRRSSLGVLDLDVAGLLGIPAQDPLAKFVLLTSLNSPEQLLRDFNTI